MFTPTIFLPEVDSDKKMVILEDSKVHHLKNVLRITGDCPLVDPKLVDKIVKIFKKNNFDYVGKNFAYEARLIHYDKKKKTKGIYGNATKKQINELHDEGIETHSFPWIDDKKN